MASAIARPLALLLVISSVACTRSASEPPQESLTTSVAATLTAAPTFPPTSTQPPSATSQFTATTTASPEPTTTETGTPGPSASPTGPPLAEGDPRRGLNLSVPNYADDFSQRFVWFEFDDENSATNLWEDGHLRTSDNVADANIWWSTSATEAASFYVEVTAEVGACSGRDGYGIGVRVGGVNFDRGYTLEISCDGAYRIRKFISTFTTPAVLLDWTEASAIKSGPDATNRLGFLADGVKLYAFANGEPLNQDPVEDGDYLAGIFSLFSAAEETAGLTVIFDDFRLWFLPP